MLVRFLEPVEVSQSSLVDLGEVNPSGDDVHRIRGRRYRTGLALP